ncbi:MAG: hypothetical protein Q7R45_12625, partial [Sulfuricaulis sp.]|nr:hypothetical protein [Sulfuricaulis sp.]
TLHASSRHARQSENSYRMLSGLLIVVGIVELVDFAGYVNLFTNPVLLAATGQSLAISVGASYQRAFFLALFAGILGGTCLWLGLRVKKRALASPDTVEETRTALAYTTVCLFAYALYYGSQSAFYPNAEPALMLAALYAIVAALIFNWAR